MFVCWKPGDALLGARTRQTIGTAFTSAISGGRGGNVCAARRTFHRVFHRRRVGGLAPTRTHRDPEQIPCDRDRRRGEKNFDQHGERTKKERRPGYRTAASFFPVPCGTEVLSTQAQKRLALLLRRLLLRRLLRSFLCRSSHRISPRSPAPICRRHKYSAIHARCNCPAVNNRMILQKASDRFLSIMTRKNRRHEFFEWWKNFSATIASLDIRDRARDLLSTPRPLLS